MNIYTIKFKSETGTVTEIGLKARNKVEAITTAINKLRSWRQKDKIVEIAIEEDAGNRELTAADYSTKGEK